MDLTAVPLSAPARRQLEKARRVTAAASLVVLLVLAAAMAIGASLAAKPNTALTVVLSVVAVLATAGFGARRIAQLTRDLHSGSVTRYAGGWREQLTRPLQNAGILRIKLPGRFMLLRNSSAPVVADAVAAGSRSRWSKAAGYLEYSTASRLLLNVERVPVSG